MKSAQYSTPIDVEKLCFLYGSGHTQAECAAILGTTQKVVWKAMKNNGIAARTAAKRDQFREKNDYWKDGVVVDKNGYVWIKTPLHPRASNCGDYVAAHILEMEKHIGRYLRWHGAADPRTEVVHHINQNKSDNRIENLLLVSCAEHMRIHNNLRKSKAVKRA